MDCFLVQAKTIHFQMDQVKTVTPAHFFLSPVTTLVLTFFSSHFPDMFLWGWSWEKEPERDRGQTLLASWSQNSCWGHIFPFKQTTLLLGQRASQSQLWIPRRKTDRAEGPRIVFKEVIMTQASGSFCCVGMPCYLLKHLFSFLL